MENRPYVGRSPIWAYFTKKDKFIATCNTCNNDYSYRSIGNLSRHYRLKHGKPGDVWDDNDSSDTSDGEHETSTKKKSTWNYYEILDSDKFEATCKLCSANVHYDSVSDLVKHVRDHGVVPKDSDDEDDVPEAQENKLRKKSQVWKYFKILDDEAKTALCCICKKTLSYSATVTNLKRHLGRKHGDVVSFKTEDEGKKIIISANGQMYEVETDSLQVDTDCEDKEPIEMDTIYLEDIEDSIDQPPTPIKNSPLKKKPNFLKRNFSKISKEPVIKLNRSTCSVEDQPKQRTTSTNSMGTLDYFGQYVVSLLKKLPTSVSDQLQSEIIKQILTSKIALESQGASNYEIVISQNDISQSNDTKPVTCTIQQNVSEKTNEVVIESTD